MKTPVLLLLIMIAIPQVLSGQNDSCRLKLYDSWYYFNSPAKEQFDVYTYEFGDTTVALIARNEYIPGIKPAVSDLRIIQIKDIDKILFRGKGSQLKGMLSCAIVGAIIGTVVGYSNGNDPEGSIGDYTGVTAGVKAFVGGVIGAGIGVGIGVPIGSIKKKVVINGDINNYQRTRPLFYHYSIRKCAP